EFYLAEGLVTQMLEINTKTLETSILWEEPEWVTHVQYNPLDTDIILYNHEWRWPLGTERIWVRDKKKDCSRKIRHSGMVVGENRIASELENVSHEIWASDGRWILYHGYDDEADAFVGRACPRDSNIKEI